MFLGRLGLLCLIILKNVEIWLDVTIAGRTDGQTNERTRKDRATQPMDHGRLRWAITAKRHFASVSSHYFLDSQRTTLLTRLWILLMETFNKDLTGSSNVWESVLQKLLQVSVPENISPQAFPNFISLIHPIQSSVLENNRLSSKIASELNWAT